jgi:hypothetical protein
MQRFVVLFACWMSGSLAVADEAHNTGFVEIKFHDVKPVKQKRPVVPSWSALKRPIVCKLDFEVDVEGSPVSVTPEECPNELHVNAVKAGMKWRFEPHQINGEAVPVNFRVVMKITH